jgi:hypothetical protein
MELTVFEARKSIKDACPLRCPKTMYLSLSSQAISILKASLAGKFRTWSLRKIPPPDPSGKKSGGTGSLYKLVRSDENSTKSFPKQKSPGQLSKLIIKSSVFSMVPVLGRE